jgi:hypothetical protein
MKMIDDHLKKFATPGPVEVGDRVAKSRYWGATSDARSALPSFGGYAIGRLFNDVSAPRDYISRMLFHAVSL